MPRETPFLPEKVSATAAIATGQNNPSAIPLKNLKRNAQKKFCAIAIVHVKVVNIITPAKMIFFLPNRSEKYPERNTTPNTPRYWAEPSKPTSGLVRFNSVSMTESTDERMLLSTA